MDRIFHTPEGVRDIINEECARKKILQNTIAEVFHRYGYMDIETPSFEYFEVFSREVGTIPSRDLYKFFDREGNTLALRPDFTPSVSRACAVSYEPGEKPVSLCYTGNTFINASGLQGRLKETTQMGVEHIGEDSAESDAEILAMVVESLLAAGLKEFQVSVGEVNYFKSLIHSSGISAETEMRLRELVSQKNEFGVEELVKEQNIPEKVAGAFVSLPQLFGSVEILERAASLTEDQGALDALTRLSEIYEILKIYGYEKYVSFDLAMLSKYQYYTGIIFQAYTYGTGEPVVKGGRYNELMKHFGKPAASIGFAIVIDSLMAAFQRQKIELPAPPAAEEILYHKNEREEAVLKAQALRKEGKAVRLVLIKEESEK